MDLDELDKQMAAIFSKMNPKFFLRIGSSLHEEEFTEKSDIDYFAVLNCINVNDINNIPGMISPKLNSKKLRAVRLYHFYWRVTLEDKEGHPVIVSMYTTPRFMEYAKQRHGNKMYILNEHKLLLGDEKEMELLKSTYKPNKETIKSDFYALGNPKYRHKFLWAWRSVCLAEENRWLKNKQEIREWVNAHYPEKLNDFDFLIEKLRTTFQGSQP